MSRNREVKEDIVDRIIVIPEIIDKKITQVEGSIQLGLSCRHMRRLQKAYEAKGQQGIERIPSGENRAFSKDFKHQCMEFVEKWYRDFTPTFAMEKLQEVHGLKVNRETLRQWMIEGCLWQGKQRRKAHIHQSRERRKRFGELVQIDGSHHDWFEGRRAKCCLLVMIDDATSKILNCIDII